MGRTKGMDQKEQGRSEANASEVVPETTKTGGKPCTCLHDRGGINCDCDRTCDVNVEWENHKRTVGVSSQVEATDDSRAMRFNKGKPQLSYMLDFPVAMEGLAKVMMKGEEKGYPRNNWKKGMPVEEVVDSMMRHLIKRVNGQKFDTGPDGTGLDHWFLVLSNAAFLAEFYGDLEGFKPKDPAITDSMVDGD